MANGNVNQTGQINLSGDVNALHLKLYANEVLQEFTRSTVMMDKVTKRMARGQKSAQFPAIGKATAEYHTPGTELLGKNIAAAERVIGLDGLLVSDVFVDKVDEATNHYDVRAPYVNQQSNALANALDVALMRETILAARSAATITGGNGGSTIVSADFASTVVATKGAALAAGIFEAGTILTEKDVGKENRFCILRPKEYAALVQDTNAINRDWGGEGSYAAGKVLRINDITIIESNNVPNDDTSVSDTRHGVDATNVYGIVFQVGAVGLLEQFGLQTESGYDMRRQGDLLITKYSMGAGILRPECAVEFTSI